MNDKKIFLRIMLRWLLVAVWMAAIYTFSAQTGRASNDISMKISGKVTDYALLPKNTGEDAEAKVSPAEIDVNFILRKSAHFFAYLILSLLAFGAMQASGFKSNVSLFASLLICLAFAVSDEYHQAFVAGRTSTVTDVLIDWAGAWSAVGLRWSEKTKTLPCFFL